jgi:hypothetical protein
MDGKRAIEIEPAGETPRLIGDVRAYWAGKCVGGRLPAREQIKPTELKAWLPHILLVDVEAGYVDFRYRLVGSAIAQDFRMPPTGRLMSDVLSPFGAESVAETLRIYRRVAEGAAPLRIRGSGDWFSQGAKTFDAVLAPLSDDGVRVNMIFGAFVFAWDEARRAPYESPLVSALKA